ncbi:MAG TPA: MlaD family protein [Gemmatimonadales bacterium]|jgi:phospholipid/cholesterol/gamma-HCH transport system substrate-binding protein
MELSYRREVTVGTLVIAAVALFIVGTTWLSGRSVAANSKDFWKIQFRDAGNLKISSVVRISGVSVGKVERIQLLDVGKVLVSVRLPERIKPKIDATATIVAVGFVGDAAVEFNPGDAPQLLTKDKIILGTQALGFADRAQQLGDKADSLLLGAQAIVNQKTADQLHATMATLQATMKAAQRTMELYSDPRTGPTAELTKTLATLTRLTARLDTTLANPTLSHRADTLTSNLAQMTSQLTVTTARLDTLLSAMNQGRGTLGKFATDSGLYHDMRDVSQSLKKVLDELQKHPGKVPVTVKIF